MTTRSTKDSVVTDFEAAAEAVGARVRAAELLTLKELPAAYLNASVDGGVGYSSDLRHLLDLPSASRPMSYPSTWVSRARLGIASTGTVLVAERLAEDRICALLCSRHVLLLPLERLVATPDEAVQWVQSFINSGLGYVTFVTGPSRTSDIEKVLTLGAHGPAALDIVLVDGWAPSDD